MSKSTPNPPNLITPPAERIAILDCWRGFAIFGILVVNIMAFSALNHNFEQLTLNSSLWYDTLASHISSLFFESKFYIIFSFLFGIGFSVQIESLAKKGVNINRFYTKRLAILFAIGLIHAYFWWGDVLRLYAILGLGLLLCRNLSLKALLLLSALFLILAQIIAIFPNLFGEFDSPTANDTIFKTLYFALIQMAPTAFALFLLGRVVGKMGLLKNLADKKALIKKVIVIGVIIWASLTGILSLLSDPYSPMTTLPKTLSDMALSSVYLAVLGLLLVNHKLALFTQSLANIGKLALSNYVLQTVICVFIFQGLNYQNKVQTAGLLVIALMIFMGQMILSHFWVKYFHYGILEWLWRSLTIGKWQMLMKS
ncbi:MAG: DUF418 domain-containing protein [Moraxella sp.]|uniref:DUF418 domain-containing protein n=1 Tax=Moraxella sp. TaxID=479 RepID=UPI0026DA98C1|nr:DUF418 domain-containing protein [Moraxella sp.]MDO4450407.1 DUF418 domain-containing protein [Moraxella sp.]